MVRFEKGLSPYAIYGVCCLFCGFKMFTIIVCSS